MRLTIGTWTYMHSFCTRANTMDIGAFIARTIANTSQMIHHHGMSLSKQQTADLLLCHGTQQDLSLSSQILSPHQR